MFYVEYDRFYVISEEIKCDEVKVVLIKEQVKIEFGLIVFFE